MADEKSQVSIGLDSAPPLSARLTKAQLDELNTKIEAGGWIDVEASDATIRLNADKVVFVKVEREEPRVGFGLGA